MINTVPVLRRGVTMTTDVNNLPTRNSHNSLSGHTSCIVTRAVPPHQVSMTSYIMAQERAASPLPLSRAMLTPPVSTKPTFRPLRWADLTQSWEAPRSMSASPTLVEVVSAQRVHPVLSQHQTPTIPCCSELSNTWFHCRQIREKSVCPS